MRNRVKPKMHKSAQNGPSTNPWNEAIQKAEHEISQIEQRAAGLKDVVQNFKIMRDSGQRFPGDTATRN